MLGEGLAAKIAGVVAGAFLALVFDPPRSRLGFVRRSTSALVAGWVFGHLVLAYAGWEETFDNVMAAWCLAAFCSWSGMTIVTRVVQAYRKEER